MRFRLTRYGILVVTLAGVARLVTAAPPANDTCAGATVIGSVPYTNVLSVAQATTTADEFSSCGCPTNGHAVWWSVTPTTSGIYAIDSQGSGADTVLTLFAGSCPVERELDCNDDYDDTRQSRIRRTLCAGRTYRMQLAAYCGSPATTGRLSVNLDVPSVPDTDGDGVNDCADTCVSTPNPAQTDTDADGNGDACDTCPTIANPRNNADVCTDGDGDGTVDATDNCRTLSNPSQTDTDSDGLGDDCDNCPTAANPDQANRDASSDALGDACDPCTDPDLDGYGTPGLPAQSCAIDNCPSHANPTQDDTDNDGVGNACVAESLLAAARPFTIMAEKSLATRMGSTLYGGGGQGIFLRGSVCAGKAVIEGIAIWEAQAGGFGLASPGDLVILKTRGTGAKLLRPRFRYADPTYSVIDGTVATAGSILKTPRIEPYYYYGPQIYGGVVNDPGDPRVQACRDGIAAAKSASAYLAALPPDQVFGDIVVGHGDPNPVITVNDGDVVQIDTLTLGGPPTSPQAKYCNDHQGSELTIQGRPLVVNIGSLRIGNCTHIHGLYGTVINVPGHGPSVSVGRAADIDGALLAPERNLSTDGSHDDEYTSLEGVWARRVKLQGLTVLR